MLTDLPLPVLDARRHAQNVALQRLRQRLGAALEGYDRARTPLERWRANQAQAAIRAEAATLGLTDEIEHLSTLWSAHHYGGPRNVTIGQVLSRWGGGKPEPEPTGDLTE